MQYWNFQKSSMKTSEIRTRHYLHCGAGLPGPKQATAACAANLFIGYDSILSVDASVSCRHIDRGAPAFDSLRLMSASEHLSMSTNHLIIGLGGTGGKIIRAFRKTLFQEFRGRRLEKVNLRYLYVDSSQEMMGIDDPSWKILGTRSASRAAGHAPAWKSIWKETAPTCQSFSFGAIKRFAPRACLT